MTTTQPRKKRTAKKTTSAIVHSNTKFGWCLGLDAVHEGCRTSYTDQYDNLHECACECHRRQLED